MPKTLSKPVDAEEIAEMADRGQDISAHFTNQFTVVRPEVPRVNVDFTAPLLKELDREAETRLEGLTQPGSIFLAGQQQT